MADPAGADPAPSGPDADDRGHPLCASADLVERGRAVVFEVLAWQRPVQAFALRFDGRIVAYLNRCLHVPVELDWQPGEFLDATRETIVCALHGARYAPHDGRCLGGPRGRGRLWPLDVSERDGEVRWYSSPASAVSVASAASAASAVFSDSPDIRPMPAAPDSRSSR